MVAHRWLGPVTDTSERCDCLICMRHDKWIDEPRGLRRVA